VRMEDSDVSPLRWRQTLLKTERRGGKLRRSWLGASGQLGEERREIDVDRCVRDGESVGVDLEQPVGGIGVGDALAGIDDPEMLDSHAEVVLHDLDGAGEAIFGRENFDAEERWVGGDLLHWGLRAESANIRDTYPG